MGRKSQDSLVLWGSRAKEFKVCCFVILSPLGWFVLLFVPGYLESELLVRPHLNMHAPYTPHTHTAALLMTHVHSLMLLIVFW
jgi:hypothetical protein